MPPPDAATPKPKRRRRWLQFSVRSLFVLTLLVAAFLGWVRYEVDCAREEEQAAAAIGALGGSARRAREIRIASDGLARQIVAHLPERVRSFLGDRFLDPVADVGFPAGVGDEALGALDHFHHLEEVHLSGSRLTPAGLQRVLRHRGLVALHLDGATITDEDVAGLLRLTRLERLHLDHTPITDQAVQVLARLPKLSYLGISGTHVTAEGVALLPGKEQASGLILGWSQAPSESQREAAAALVQAKAAVHAVRQQNGLVVYHVSYGGPSGDAPEVLASLLKLPNLRELGFGYVSLNDDSLDHLRRLTTVEQLCLRHTPLGQAGWDRLTQPLPDPQLGKAPALSGLRFLAVFGGADLASISRLTQLETLVIETTDAELRHVESLTNLRELILQPELVGVPSSPVSDAGLRHLAGLVRLERLTLPRSGNIRGPGLVHLAGLTRLEGLELSYSAIDDASLVHLGRLTSLRKLNLSYPSAPDKITGAGLVHLGRLTRLEVLALNNTGVDDASLVHLAPLTNLQDLHLRGTRVTDAGVKHLLGFRRLVRLYLPKSVSAEAIAELKAALPDAEIETP